MKRTKEELEQTALKVREHIIKMSKDGGCFIGASLSCADLLVFLYSNFLKVNKENANRNNRDYLFLSKGHDVPALYGTFAELGFLEAGRLENHLNTNDSIYWHPNTNIYGVEFHSGSLGHLPSVAAGVAFDCRLRNSDSRVVVILGDGELNEGSVWETIQVAAAFKLDNMIFVVDRNRFQANMRTEELIKLEPLERKFEAFGTGVLTCNGHDFDDLEEIFSKVPFVKNTPSVVIAETVRGKGLPSISERADRWFCSFTAGEVEGLLNELHTNELTQLKSETLTVR